MDIGTITSAYQGLKTAKELLTSAFDAKVDSEAKPKIQEAQARLGEVQDTLFSLREQLFELQDERNKLKAELEATQGWQGKLDQYEMIKTTGGAIVYQSKEEPVHYACPSCINKKQFEILQDNRTINGHYRCTGCKSEFPIEPRKKVQVRQTRTSSSYW